MGYIRDHDRYTNVAYGPPMKKFRTSSFTYSYYQNHPELVNKEIKYSSYISNKAKRRRTLYTFPTFLSCPESRISEGPQNKHLFGR